MPSVHDLIHEFIYWILFSTFVKKWIYLTELYFIIFIISFYLFFLSITPYNYQMFSTFGPSIYRPMTLRDKMIVGEPSSFINVCQIVTTLTPRRKGGGGESSGADNKCVLCFFLYSFLVFSCLLYFCCTNARNLKMQHVKQ